MADTKIALLKGKKIRKIVHNNELWYVIEDVVRALTDSTQPDAYIDDMKRRDPEFSKGWEQIAVPLSIPTPCGTQQMECANMEGVFRIIQSIPSAQAEFS